VLPRRAASWRSFASRSFGSFTVVRFIVCQHTSVNCHIKNYWCPGTSAAGNSASELVPARTVDRHGE
jgi:hypothetical protein